MDTQSTKLNYFDRLLTSDRQQSDRREC